MIRGVLDFVAVHLQDTIEGVVADDLAEGLKCDGLDNVALEGRADLQGDGFDLINGHGHRLAVLLDHNVLRHGRRCEVARLLGSFAVRILVVLVFMMFFGVLGSRGFGFFKVSFLIWESSQLLGHCLVNFFAHELSHLGVGHKAGKLARLEQSLLD